MTELHVITDGGHAYTISQAMALAKAEKYHPDPPPTDAPEMSAAEALRVVQASLDASSFNWLTGQAARDVLKKQLGIE